MMGRVGSPSAVPARSARRGVALRLAVVAVCMIAIWACSWLTCACDAARACVAQSWACWEALGAGPPEPLPGVGAPTSCASEEEVDAAR
eukprot:14785071-Alexandrium_andersonii.AAC.1